MDPQGFDFPLDPALANEDGTDDVDAEAAALEAIRVAINNNNQHHDHGHGQGQDHSGHVDTLASHSGASNAPVFSLEQQEALRTASQAAQVEKAIQNLGRLSGQNASALEGMDFQAVLGGMITGLQELQAGLRRQEQLAGGLTAQLGGDPSGMSSV